MSFYLVQWRTMKRHGKRKTSYGPFGSIRELHAWAKLKGLLEYDISFEPDGQFIPISDVGKEYDGSSNLHQCQPG